MCCSGFLRVIMIVFNGIIFLAGAALLGVGIWVKVNSDSLQTILGNIENAPEQLNQIFNVGYLLIAVGAVLVLMGFLGCFGAIRESPCMLLTFFIIVLLIFIAEVAAAILVFVFKPLVKDLIDKLGTEAVKSIRKQYGENDDLTGLWNTTMNALNCCGFYNYTDFTGSPFNNMTAGRYPDTCCLNSPCTLENAADAKVAGCYPELVNLLESNAVIVGGVATGVTALEIAAMVVSLALYRKSSHQDSSA